MKLKKYTVELVWVYVVAPRQMIAMTLEIMSSMEYLWALTVYIMKICWGAYINFCRQKVSRLVFEERLKECLKCR